ncbi:MAG TPA: Ig-like domain-containing protein [Longimicrobiales bacterium]
MNRWMRATAIMAIAALTACSDDPTRIVEVDRVEVGPADQVLVVGDSVEITAVPLTSKGDVVVGEILWRNLRPDLATLRVSGGTAVVNATAPGTARIEAESGGRTGSVMITVLAQSQVASIELQPTTLVLENGEQGSIQAIAKAASGQVITGRAVTWNVVSGVAVSIVPQADGAVLVSADDLGVAVIRATIDGVTADADVQVVDTAPPPQTVATVDIAPSSFSLPVNHQASLQAIAKTATGEIITGRTVTWTLTVDSVATVEPIGTSTFASFTAKKPGTTKVRATIDGITGEATVQVTAVLPPPSSQPSYMFFPAGQQAAWKGHALGMAGLLTAIGQNGPIANPTVLWEVEDSTIASIDAAGNLTGLSAGRTRVRASSGSVYAYTYVTVFELPSGDQAYDLTYDWWDGQVRLAPLVGSESWTDANGAQHQVSLYAVAGSLVMKSNGRYERVITVEGWIFPPAGTGQKVIDRDLLDEGIVAIIIGGETGYRMISETTPGYEWKLLGAYKPGHVTMRAAIGTAPEHEYLFRQSQ